MIRLAVRCRPEAAEAVLAELLVLAPGGVEQEDGPGWVEYAIYGVPGELPELGSVRAYAGPSQIEVTSEEIPDDWADRWRDFHQPVLIGGRVLVRPSCKEAGAEQPAPTSSGTSWPPAGPQAPLDAPGGAIPVVVDPGQAFGTGAHTTTRLCIELLLELADAGQARGTLVDLGTGSGVLAIAAAKLGFGPVAGVDSEVAAVEAARANAAANHVELEVARANLREDVPPLAETVVANLTAPLLEEVAGRIAGRAGRAPRARRVPRALVCSGLMTSQAEGVESAFAAAGLGVETRRAEGDWAALRLAPR